MPRHSIVITIAALLALAMPIAAQESNSTAPKSASRVVTVIDQDNGKDIDLPQGGILLVKLDSNPSTGYSWAVAGNSAPLKLEKTTVRKGNQSDHMAGAPGTQELRFSGISAGVALLTLEYRRPWEHDVAAARTFSVKVKVR